jgi:hypothetical protein
LGAAGDDLDIKMSASGTDLQSGHVDDTPFVLLQEAHVRFPNDAADEALLFFDDAALQVCFLIRIRGGFASQDEQEPINTALPYEPARQTSSNWSHA